MSRVCLQFVIVVVPDHTHLLFLTSLVSPLDLPTSIFEMITGTSLVLTNFFDHGDVLTISGTF